MRTLAVLLASALLLVPRAYGQSCNAELTVEGDRKLSCDNQPVRVTGGANAPIQQAMLATNAHEGRDGPVTLSLSLKSKGWNFVGIEEARLVWPNDSMRVTARRGVTQIRNGMYFEQVVIGLHPSAVDRIRQEHPTHLIVRGARVKPNVLLSHLRAFRGL
jgi:hypothetical protein